MIISNKQNKKGRQAKWTARLAATYKKIQEQHHTVLSRSQILVQRIEEFMNRRYEFRHNLLKGDVEYRERKAGDLDFRPVTERTINTACLEAQLEGIELWDKDVKRFIYSDRTPSFNPLNHYLSHLPAWDGIKRIHALAEMLPTANKIWPEQFYIWFLGMVAQWKQMDPQYGNCIVPLLAGAQGCGKSTWCRLLLPPVLRDYLAENLEIGNHREAELALGRFALINLDEFDTIGTSQQAFLKHLLQKPVVHTRLPYGRSIQTCQRFSTFIATCNNLDLLTDPTGSRRFICIELNGRIHNEQPILYDQVYAEAVYALQQGERYWFTSEEEERNMQYNREFQQMPMEESLFLQYFRRPEAEEKGQWLSVSELLLYIQEKSKVKLTQTHMNFFGRILLKNNILRKHTNRGNLWHVLKNSESRITI